MSHPDSESEFTKRALLPAGLRDILPLDAAHEAAVTEAPLAQFSAHGYDRVKPPLVEFETSFFSRAGCCHERQHLSADGPCFAEDDGRARGYDRADRPRRRNTSEGRAASVATLLCG